jgi:diguanylate cyclase (GGDEF)-like protein/PAS domain S-box-containing protein
VEHIDWSRPRLCELVQGRAVFVRDPTGANVPIPSWLGAAAEIEWVVDAGASLEAVHPDDGMKVVEAFLAALEHPGTPSYARVREQIGDSWFHVEVSWLNQMENPDVNGLIGTREVMGVAAVDSAEAGDPGESGATSWVMLELDRTGVIRSARGEVWRTFGWEPGELVGRSLASLIPRDAVADSIANWMTLWADSSTTRVNRRRYRRADGREIWVESSFLHDGDRGVICVLIDISDRVERERELSQLTEQLALLADAVPTALARCDATGRVLFHNARWAELAGGDETESHLHDIVAEHDSPRLCAAFTAAVQAPVGDRRVLELASADDTVVWEITLQPIGDPGDDRVIVASVHDATDTVQLRRAARHDGLTGLLNRSATEAQLAAALTDDPAGTLVVYLDLDRFKTVNDTHGHEAGDQVLRAVGRRLRSAVRPGDDVGRFGGDEFVLVCRGVDPGMEGHLVDRLAASLTDPVAVAGGQWRPAASIGCARAEPGDDLAGVIRRADLAMFDIKRARAARP